MRILMVHNRYLQRGGEDESYEAESDLLEAHGWQVERYEEDNLRIEQLGRVRTAARSIWSWQAHRYVREAHRLRHFDILHVQNFFPLISPSVYAAARSRGAAVVQTLRNYRLLCPVGTLFRDGQVCEDCVGRRVAWPGIRHRCYRQSAAASGAVAAMVGIHNMLDTWTDMVDVYVAPTHFARAKFVEGGLPAERIMVKPNCVHPDPGVGAGDGGFALYVGRLSPEKGIGTLLAAWSRLQQPPPLKIVGDGPLAAMVRKAGQSIRAMEWLGWRPNDEVLELIGRAAVLIMPSIWYETFGRVVIEAFAKGTPVIASNLGAVAELVTHGATGRLFAPGDPAALAAEVDWLFGDARRLGEMRRAARASFEKSFSAERNFAMLSDIYARARAMAQRRAGNPLG